MDNFLSNILLAVASPSTVHLDFIRDYKKKSKSLHIFLEGKGDFSFYTNFISQININHYEVFYYNCNNKDGAYVNHSLINWNAYSKDRALFFVDKDYSNYLSKVYCIDSNIFVTKYYSIESYIVNEYVLVRILGELVGMSNRTLIDTAVDLFKREYSNFLDIFTPITCWIIIQKRNYPDFTLKNLDLKYVFHFSDMRLIKKTQCNGGSLLSYLNMTCNGGSMRSYWSDFSILMKKMRANNHKDHLRGKFEMWFFVKFIEEYLRYLNSNIPSTYPKYRISTNLSVSNSIQHMGPRTVIPPDLHQFLINHYMNL